MATGLNKLRPLKPRPLNAPHLAKLAKKLNAVLPSASRKRKGGK